MGLARCGPVCPVSTVVAGEPYIHISISICLYLYLSIYIYIYIKDCTQRYAMTVMSGAECRIAITRVDLGIVKQPASPTTTCSLASPTTTGLSNNNRLVQLDKPFRASRFLWRCSLRSGLHFVKDNAKTVGAQSRKVDTLETMDALNV